MATTTIIRAIRRGEFGSVQIASSGGNVEGDVIAVGDGRLGVVAGLESIDDTALMTLDVVGQFDILKQATTDVYAYSAPVYYDPVTKKAYTASGAGYLYAGRCVKASVSGDVYVYTDLNVSAPKRYAVYAVTALGSIQTDAAPLIEGLNVVTGANGTLGVILPVAVPGMEVIIKGVTSGVLKVYGNTGAIINGLSANAAISLTTGLMPSIFVASTATQWYTIPLVAS